MVQVKIAGKGVVAGDEVTRNAEQAAQCDLCGKDVDAVAAVGETYGCKTCLRERLEAMTLSAYMLDSSAGLPWGKVTS